MTNAFLPRGAKPGSIMLGTVEEFARQIDEADLFNVFPRVPESIRESEAFTETLTYPVWLKVFRKGTIRAGAATRRGKIIELNSKLFTIGTKQDVRETFLHETAHILADLYYSRDCNHNWRWVRMARLLGDTGDRCHDYDYLIAERKPRSLTYVCTICNQVYHRAKRMNTRRLRCGRCRGELRLEVQVSDDLRKALGL